ncbi:MAG: DUF5715 family protein [Bacteroides sp.]|nr:DUF5715 family protein [Bacteroides sp.]
MQQTPPQKPRRKQRRRFSPRKALRLLLPVVLFIGLCVVMCTPTHNSEGDGTELVTENRDDGTKTSPTTGDEAIAKDEEPVVTTTQVADAKRKYRNVRELECDTVSQFLAHLEEMPEPTTRIKVNYFGDLRQCFNDSNYIHWQEAELYGIKPLTDTRSHWKLRTPIVKVNTCEDFFLDTLIFSRPYLVPVAAGRLHEIGRRFRDSINARGGGDYRIKVTSLLRTPRTVKRLRRRNRNAIDSSVHQLGTTFDISYASFIASNADNPRSVDDLKGILAEVLKAMREEGKIWVKYERGQPCFHITARKKHPSEEKHERK